MKQSITLTIFLAIAGIIGFATARVTHTCNFFKDDRVQFTSVVKPDSSMVFVEGDTAWASDGIFTMSKDSTIMFNNVPLWQEDQAIVRAFIGPWQAQSVSVKARDYMITLTCGKDTTVEIRRGGMHIEPSPAVRELLIRKLGRY